MMKYLGGTLIAGLVVASSHPAFADAPSTIDMQEHIFGASNTNAVAGHGKLTAGISSDGDLTVLSWPSPSFTDQLAYISSNALDVRAEPHFGAADGMGSYVGLLVTTSNGTVLTWLRDPAFSHVQRYTQPDAPVPETTFSRTDLGLSIVLTDVVSPDVDVLTRRVVVTRTASSPVTAVSLVLYENLSPTTSRIPMLPFADWVFDARTDFIAAYDATAHAVVHFHPADRAVIQSLGDVSLDLTTVDYGPADALMKKAAPTDADVDGLLASIDSAYSPGVAALVTTDPLPTSFQVGSDASPLCEAVGTLTTNLKALSTAFPGFVLPIDPGVFDGLECTDPLASVRTARGWVYAPDDALADLADGSLSGSRLAACKTNAALVAPLTFTGDSAEGSAIFAFGATVAAARSELAKGTMTSAAARQTAAEGAAHAALGAVVLPDPKLGQRVVDVARRSLVNVYVARDAKNGGVVASLSHQPPYYLDWPRDGSFFQQGLDVAGLLPWVTERASWYATLLRQEPVAANPLITPNTTVDPDTGEKKFPAYAWEMNYYSDGIIGGNIRFEIDNTALHLWSTVAHIGALDVDARAKLIADVWPSMKQALGLLRRWRDPVTGLPWPANEDDHLELTSTLHGATAVYAGLVGGARLANAAGDVDEAQATMARIAELKAAIITNYFDPKSGLFRDTPMTGTDYIPGTTGGDSTAWLAWPARLLDADDPRLEAQLAGDLAAVMPDIRGETAGAAYVMKNVVSAALLGKDGGSRDVARDAVTRLANIATADTMHFGEVFITTHPSGQTAPVFSARVAQPHVWEGMLFYLSAMALTAPERFDLEIASLPLPSVSAPPPAISAEGGGCSCRVADAPRSQGNSLIGASSPPDSKSPWFIAFLPALLLVLRRARKVSAARPDDIAPKKVVG